MQSLYLGSHGGVYRRRGQADPARSTAALREAQGQREEQEAFRTARCTRVQPGD